MEHGAHRIPSTCDSGYLLRVCLHVISNMVHCQGTQLEKVQEKAFAMSPIVEQGSYPMVLWQGGQLEKVQENTFVMGPFLGRNSL